jgi:hypothetical protein
MSVVDGSFDFPMEPEERAAAALAGGIMQHGYQCGMIWGATLAAGAQAYRLHGAGPRAEAKAIIAARGLLESFRAQNRHTNCLEITEVDRSSSTMEMIKYFLIRGGTIKCFRIAVKYASTGLGEIESALSGRDIEVPTPPVSCSALLAQKMGVSDMHALMAAGLAGGIGLSGGACGALGAAIWVAVMKSVEERGAKVSFKSPEAAEVIDRFVKHTDFEFECLKIVGRKFENIGDHSAYLRDGGCSELIEDLAVG